MRFTLTVLAWVVMVGGLSLYVQLRDAGYPVQTAAAPRPEAAEARYTLELTATFSAEADPFALQTDEQPTSGVTLRVNGQVVPVEETALRRGTPHKISDLPGLVEGNNELHLQASPPVTESHLDHGVRLRLLHQGRVVAERTVWSPQGALVSGSLPFTLTHEEDGHDH